MEIFHGIREKGELKNNFGMIGNKRLRKIKQNFA